jgi:hypothetical protein
MMSESSNTPGEEPVQGPAPGEKKGGVLRSLMLPVIVIGGYFALQLWILPAAGIPT